MNDILKGFNYSMEGVRPPKPKITDFTAEEVGALVAAVGMIAHARGLYIGAVQDGCSDEILVKILAESPYYIDAERAGVLIEFKIGDYLDEIIYGEGR